MLGPHNSSALGSVGMFLVKKNSDSNKTWNFMLQSLFPKENLNTDFKPVLNPKIKVGTRSGFGYVHL